MQDALPAHQERCSQLADADDVCSEASNHWPFRLMQVFMMCPRCRDPSGKLNA